MHYLILFLLFLYKRWYRLLDMIDYQEGRACCWSEEYASTTEVEMQIPETGSALDAFQPPVLGGGECCGTHP